MEGGSIGSSYMGGGTVSPPVPPGGYVDPGFTMPSTAAPAPYEYPSMTVPAPAPQPEGVVPYPQSTTGMPAYRQANVGTNLGVQSDTVMNYGQGLTVPPAVRYSRRAGAYSGTSAGVADQALNSDEYDDWMDVEPRKNGGVVPQSHSVRRRRAYEDERKTRSRSGLFSPVRPGTRAARTAGR